MLNLRGIRLYALFALLILPATVSHAVDVTGQVWNGATPMSPPIESAHPYAAYADQTWTFTSPSGANTRIHFDRIDTETGYDYVTVMDGADNIIASYAGWDKPDIWTPWVPGNVVKIRLTSDHSVQGYGFYVDRYITDDLVTGVPNVQVSLSPGGLSDTTGAYGIYTIPDVPAGAYTATAALAGWAFTPASSSVTVTATVGATASFEGWQDHISVVNVSPNPYTPTGTDAATIVATGEPGHTGLFARVVGGVVDEIVNLSEPLAGSYTGTWDGFDHRGVAPMIPVSGSYSVRIYNDQADPFALVGVVTINSVDSVSASPATFYPTTGQTTTVTVIGVSGLPLELRVVNSSGTVVRTLPLVGTGTYTAVWDGKNESASTQPLGNYELRVHRADTGARYTATSSVTIGVAGGVSGYVWSGATAVVPQIESAHPYAPFENQTWTLTSTEGTKTRVHFDRIDTEPNYDFVSVQDSAGNTYASYAGWGMTDIWSPWVPGNTVKIVFTSDRSIQGYGFLLDRYTTDASPPLAGVTVTLSPGGRTGTTGADGAYSIPSLTPGTYTVTPSMTGWAFSPASLSVAVSSTVGGFAEFEGFDNHITSLTASPDPFAPSGVNSTTITAVGRPGETGIYVKVNAGSTLETLDLTETSSGNYTATWDGLDTSVAPPVIGAGAVYGIAVYNKASDRFTANTTLTLNSITAVSASPNPFYAASGQTTTITVYGSSGLPLEVRVADSGGTVIRTLPLTWGTSSYTAIWDGKDTGGVVQAPGDHALGIYRSDTGTGYLISGTVTIGQAGGVSGTVWVGATAVLPQIESAHPYAPFENSSWTLTSTEGTKTRVHFDRIDTEPGYDFVKVQDAAGNTYATYAGWGMTDIWSPWVPGNTVNIVFTSDHSIQGYGFLLDRYTTDAGSAGIAGVTVTLSPGGLTAVTGTDGAYNIPDLAPGTYTATPSLAGWAFSPASLSVSVSSTVGGVADFEGFDNHITSLTAAPNPFEPSGANSTIITAVGNPGETGIYAQVSGAGLLQRHDLTETSSGNYTVEWDGLDHSGAEPLIPVSTDFAVTVYNKASDRFPISLTLATNSVNTVSASPNPFYPTAGQSTAISVTGAAGLPLEARIADAGGTVVRTLPLSGVGTTYTATWDGKDEGAAYAPAGSYQVYIHRSDTGARYAATVTLVLGAAPAIAGQAWIGSTPVRPFVQTGHPYNPNENRTFTITSTGGTKTRIHFDRIETENSYDFIRVQDGEGNTIISYTGADRYDVWSPWVPGNTVKIVFTSDYSQQRYGFLIDRCATDVLTPVPDVTVTMTPGGRNTPTDAGGNYSMTDFVPGTYTATPTLVGWRFSPAAPSVILSAGLTTTADFEGWEDWLTDLSCAPNPYAPSGTNAVTITGSGRTGESGLVARVLGGAIEKLIPMSETTPGSYTADWDGLDTSTADPRITPTNSFSVNVYNAQGDPFTQTAALTVNTATAISASPASFYGTAGQTTTITVSGASGLPLELRIVNPAGTVVRTIPLAWNGGAYTAIWDAKNDGGVVQAPDAYELRVHRSDTAQRYAVTASATILPAAAVTGYVRVGGTALLPVLESAHPYANNENTTSTITSTGGTKTRVHFEKIDMEYGTDHIYVKDNAGNVIADYHGTFYDIWSPWVTGNVVKIQLVSNSSVTAYGFLIDRYGTDVTAAGIPGVTVTITPGGRTTVTGADGSYLVNDLVPGSYTLTPALTGWIFDPVSIGVTVSSGATSTADFSGTKEGETLSSIAQARLRPDGWSVDLPYEIVSATFAGSFYIEEEDRSAGIRVDTATPVLEGNMVHVIGRLSTINGERVIQPYSMDVQVDNIDTWPLGTTNKSLVGGQFGAYTPGAADGKGLNSSGLLVTVWGTVGWGDSTGFYIDDGSRVSGGNGVWVSLLDLSPGRSFAAPAAGKTVCVTGVAATRSVGATLQRIVKPRAQEDVVEF